MAKEIRVAVLVLYFYDEIGRKEFNEMSDSDLLDICEGDGMVFSLTGFQNAINDDDLVLENCFIRFCEAEVG
jgi:hypothetical protein